MLISVNILLLVLIKALAAVFLFVALRGLNFHVDLHMTSFSLNSRLVSYELYVLFKMAFLKKWCRSMTWGLFKMKGAAILYARLVQA